VTVGPQSLEWTEKAMSPIHSDRIVTVEAWSCSLAMASELRLGAIRYRTRDYVIVRLTNAEGVQGVAAGYSRTTPLLAAVRTLSDHFKDLDPNSAIQVLRKRFAPGWGAMVRAASLIDIALTDIRARQLEQPLAQLFGSRPAQVPLMAVAGYFLDQRGPAAIVDET